MEEGARVAKEGLVIMINVDDKLESLWETPAQLEASQAPCCVKCGHVRRGLLLAQQAPSTHGSISIFMSIS